MEIKRFVRDGKVVAGLAVTREELKTISEKCNYVSISKSDFVKLFINKDNIRTDKDNTVGVIFGDIGNVLYDLDNRANYEIVSNPDCWFVINDVLEERYKPINSKFRFYEIEPLSITRRVKKIARLNWNGNKRPDDPEFKLRMWVTYVPGSIVKIAKGSPYYEAGLRGEIEIKGHFDLFTPQGHMQPGWLPSQADLIADDWIIVD